MTFSGHDDSTINIVLGLLLLLLLLKHNNITHAVSLTYGEGGGAFDRILSSANITVLAAVSRSLCFINNIAPARPINNIIHAVRALSHLREGSFDPKGRLTGWDVSLRGWGGV